MGHIQHLFLESLVKMDHFQKEPPLNLKGPLAHKVEYPFSASAEQCPLLSESRHFVSPIEMSIGGSGDNAGFAQRLNDDRPGVDWMMPSR